MDSANYEGLSAKGKNARRQKSTGAGKASAPARMSIGGVIVVIVSAPPTAIRSYDFLSDPNVLDGQHRLRPDIGRRVVVACPAEMLDGAFVADSTQQQHSRHPFLDARQGIEENSQRIPPTPGTCGEAKQVDRDEDEQYWVDDKVHIVVAHAITPLLSVLVGWAGQ